MNVGIGQWLSPGIAEFISGRRPAGRPCTGVPVSGTRPVHAGLGQMSRRRVALSGRSVRRAAHPVSPYGVRDNVALAILAIIPRPAVPVAGPAQAGENLLPGAAEGEAPAGSAAVSEIVLTPVLNGPGQVGRRLETDPCGSVTVRIVGPGMKGRA